MILGSFKTTQELRQQPPTWIPEQPTTANYQDLVDRGMYRGNPSTTRGFAIFLGVLLCGLVAVVLAQLSLVADVWVVVVGGALGLAPAVSFGWHMPMRTAYGTQVRRETLGFFEMMRHRENYMAWVVDKQPDGLKYEEYLPYAVAFDLIEHRLHVDTTDGRVTLFGIVPTEEAKFAAGADALSISGVRAVDNTLQVVAEVQKFLGRDDAA